MAGINVVGVQFRRAGKIYDFNGGDLSLQIGDKVVVDTERGSSLAEVKRIEFALAGERDVSKLKPIVRVAGHKDLNLSKRLTVEQATAFTKDKIKSLELNMHVIDIEIQFGGNKVLIYFSAPGRVDFRELVKELASGLKTRVELKQVGARDEAKLAGGVGICGREFCCSSFLREFVPVSIKMAKNQNLALNPSKVSGGCGRLLCCLTYEDETYSQLRQKLLPRGTRVELPDGAVADVIRGDILNQTTQVETSSGELLTVAIDKLTVLQSGSQAKGDQPEDEWAEGIDFDALLDSKSDESDAVASSDQKTDGGRAQKRHERSPSSKSDSQKKHRKPWAKDDERRGDSRPGKQGFKARHRDQSQSSPSSDGQSQDGKPRSSKRWRRFKKNPKNQNPGQSKPGSQDASSQKERPRPKSKGPKPSE